MKVLALTGVTSSLKNMWIDYNKGEEVEEVLATTRISDDNRNKYQVTEESESTLK